MLFYQVVIIMTLLSGCQSDLLQVVKTPTSTPAFDPNEDISLANQPRWLQLFHLNPLADVKDNVIILTWYDRPYPKSFDVLLFSDEGVVKVFHEIPTWGTKGGRSPSQLNANELRSVDDIIQTLPKQEIPTSGNDATVIVLSLKTDEEERDIITCTELECPPQVEDLFQMAYNAFLRNSSGQIYLPMPYIAD